MSKKNKTAQAKTQQQADIINKDGLIDPNTKVEVNDKPSLSEKLKEAKDKLFATPEQLQAQTADRADVTNAIERSIGGNPSVGFIDRLEGNATGLNNPVTPVSTEEAREAAKSDKSIADIKKEKEESTDTIAPENESIDNEAIEEITEEQPSDTPVEKENKQRYKKSMESIWDAYFNGEIDAGTATYFTLDSLATLSKNLGRMEGNVAAQYTGGTIDNNEDKSRWEERRDRMFGEETEAEAEQELNGPSSRKAESENLDLQKKELLLEYTQPQLEANIKQLEQMIKMNNINLDNAQDRRLLIDTIKAKYKPGEEMSKWDAYLITSLSQSGVVSLGSIANGLLNTAGSVAGMML